MQVIISDMTLEDARQKAYVHWKAWQETYSELIGQKFLETRTLDTCIRMAIQHPRNTLVAKINHKVVRFSKYGKKIGRVICSLCTS